MKIRTKRIFSRIAIVFLALIVLILAARAILTYTTGKKLESAVSRLRTEGKRLSLGELEPNCADEDNAALLWKGIEDVFIGDFDNAATINQPFAELFNGRPLSAEAKKLIEAASLKNQKAFELLRASAGKPCFKYNTQWQDVSRIEFPDAVKILRCQRLFLLSLILDAEGGNAGRALDGCLDGLRSAHLFLGEPFLINRLVALALLRHQMLALNTIVRSDGIDPERLDYLLLLLESIPLRATFPSILEWERVISLGFYDIIIRQNEDIIETPFPVINSSLSWLLRPLVNGEALYSLGLWELVEPAFRLPYYESKEVRKQHKRRIEDIPWRYRMIGYLVPNFSATFVKETDREADLAVARIGLACRIFKHRHGRLPENLAELSPDILKDIPIDPYTGASLIYKKSEDGFIVYSIGSNEKDDGGRETWMRYAEVMEKDDDIAWKDN
ncbi:MAG: hypothetical protein WBC70_02220 [Candidatus Aminicenantales bacterium]